MTDELLLMSTRESSTMASLSDRDLGNSVSSNRGDEGFEWEVDLIDTEELSDADSELTLEIFIILALEEELGTTVARTGAGGNGNIVFEDFVDMGDADLEDTVEEEFEFSFSVTLLLLLLLLAILLTLVEYDVDLLS